MTTILCVTSSKFCVCLYVYETKTLKKPKTVENTAKFAITQDGPKTGQFLKVCNSSLDVMAYDNPYAEQFTSLSRLKARIATQLNSTRQREQQLTQFVGRDVINKNTTDLAVRCSTWSVEFS